MELPKSADLPIEYTGKVDENGWARFEVHYIACDLCPKEAAWCHPKGGWRCYICARPAE